MKSTPTPYDTRNGVRKLADARAAVAAAYGWPADVAAADALGRLLALNLERSAAQKE